MALSVKLSVLLLYAGHAYAKYFGGIAVGPLLTDNGSAACPPGTSQAISSAFCCPAGTQLDTSNTGTLICCPSSGDCTQDLLNSGLQCADPTMTLFRSGAGALLCCPSGYFVSDLRYCVTSGTHAQYTTAVQSNSLALDAATSSVTITGSAATGQGKASSTTTGLSTSTSHAAGNNLNGAAGVVGALGAVGMMLLV